jgi:poly(hydroxyalkanoate) granule-associated protein
MARSKRNSRSRMTALIERGTALRRKGERLALATVRQARAAVSARADEARTRTAAAVSKLEKVFEQRVSQAMSRLGVPSARDVRNLSQQVEQLQKSVQQLRRSRARA